MRSRLLHNRDFMLLWSGGTLSEIGSQASLVALPLLVLSLTGSPAKAGIVGLAKWLPISLFSLPAGMLADHLDRKRLMIVSDALRLVGATSIVAVLLLGRPPFAQIVVVAFLDGVFTIVSYVCERGALRQLVPAERLRDAAAQNEARSFGAAIVGPSLGGALYSLARLLPFVADAVSFLCSIVAVGLTRKRFQQEATPGGRRGLREMSAGELRREVGGGWSWLRKQPFYRTAATLFAFGNPVYVGLFLLAVLLAKRHGASSSLVGAMFAIDAAGGLLGALLAGKVMRRLSPHALLAGENWVLLSSLLLLLVVHNALLIGLLVALAEFSTPVVNSVVGGSRIAAAPDHLQGRVQAISSLISMSLGWLGPLAVGFTFQHAGPTVTILGASAWTLALALTATLSPSLRRHAPTQPSPEGVG